MFRRFAVACSQKALKKEQQTAACERASDENSKRHLKHALRNHERLEWHRKWRNGGNENAGHGMLNSQCSNSTRSLALSLAIVGLPALARKPVNPNASSKRAKRSHGCVIRHAKWMAAGKLH